MDPLISEPLTPGRLRRPPEPRAATAPRPPCQPEPRTARRRAHVHTVSHSVSVATLVVSACHCSVFFTASERGTRAATVPHCGNAHRMRLAAWPVGGGTRELTASGIPMVHCQQCTPRVDSSVSAPAVARSSALVMQAPWREVCGVLFEQFFLLTSRGVVVVALRGFARHVAAASG